jgi:DNA-binding NtrC family response regulator
MAGGRFRKDLFYRLRGGWLHLPPLRQRTEDIPLLTEHFLGTAGPAGSASISPPARALLCRYGFPGNVRELKSIIQAAANLAGGRPIEPRHLPAALREAKPAVDDCGNRVEAEPPASLEAVERAHILKVYRATGRNKARTAAVLGIGLNTLRRKLARYGEG